MSGSKSKKDEEKGSGKKSKKDDKKEKDNFVALTKKHIQNITEEEWMSRRKKCQIHYVSFKSS